MKSLLIAAGLILSTGVASAQVAPAADARRPASHAVVSPADIQWAPAPASLPPGARATVLEGDPAQPGPFTMRLWMPDGYRIAPHYHGDVERITVISGTFLLGMGEAFEASKLHPLETGAYASMSEGMRHFAEARGETVVQLNNIGPWTLHYVNPADDPRNAPDR